MNPVLGNRLYWYLIVEVALEDKIVSKMYGRVVFKYMNKILEVGFKFFPRCCTVLILAQVGERHREARIAASARSHD